MGDRALVAFLLIAFGVITYQSIQAGVFPPVPARFVGITLVGSVLGVISLASSSLAAALAAAVVLGLIVTGGNLPGFRQTPAATTANLTVVK